MQNIQAGESTSQSINQSINQSIKVFSTSVLVVDVNSQLLGGCQVVNLHSVTLHLNLRLPSVKLLPNGQRGRPEPGTSGLKTPSPRANHLPSVIDPFCLFLVFRGLVSVTIVIEGLRA